MLTHLSISNFTLVDQLELELSAGMTAITGETGAGKSVLLDAMALALGDRADADKVRRERERADIHASFDISKLPDAKRWLKDNDLPAEECLIRRIVTREGRSRASVNGRPVTLGQLRELGGKLLELHAQHEHQSLLQKNTQRQVLDDYGKLEPLVDAVKAAYRDWQSAAKQLQVLQENAAEHNARVQLLSYQVEELDQLNFQVGEVEHLEVEQKRLANSEKDLQQGYQLSGLLGAEDQSVLEGLNRALHVAEEMTNGVKDIEEAKQLLQSALIQVEEAQRNIEHFVSQVDLDPEQLHEVEARLSSAFDVARKHQIPVTDLAELHQNLAEELRSLTGDDQTVEALEEKVTALETEYRNLAGELSRQRQSTAIKLEKAIAQQLKALAMGGTKIAFTLTPFDEPNLWGMEEVELQVSPNPGEPLKPLAKIASGGELSRMSLAIQVVTAKTSNTPTLVFDEVDVGIGGATADTVGKLLRELGQQAQVICVTHLGQVASKANAHLRVEKTSRKGSTQTRLVVLEQEEKVTEIARMIGSDKITDTSIEHARELLAG